MSNDIDKVNYRINDMMHQLERLNTQCSDNMKRLDLMIREFKGLVAMVRPQVKKTGWYGDEIKVQPEPNESKLIPIELKSK